MNLKFWKQPATTQETSIQVVTVPSIDLTMDQWRSQGVLVGKAKESLDAEPFTTMVQVLRNESPANKGLPLNATAAERVVMQAKIEGYNLCLANLRLLAVAKGKSKPLEATFEPEEKE